MAEWLAFAVLRDRDAVTPLRTLLESYEIYAASEGAPSIPEIAFVRHLESLGLPREGARFSGIRVHTSIPPLRLLTKLESYGFRFIARDGQLAWREPPATSDLERRVVRRHRAELAAALQQIEESRALLRGASPLPSHWPLRISRHAA